MAHALGGYDRSMQPSSANPGAAPPPKPTVYICADCDRRSAEPGACPCGAGAYIDMFQPNVAEALADEDQRRMDRAKQRNLWIAVGVGIASVVFFIATTPKVFLGIPLPLPFANPIKGIALMILVAVVTGTLLDELVPAKPKYPELRTPPTPEEAARRRRNRNGMFAAAAVGVLGVAGLAIVSNLLAEKKDPGGARTTGGDDRVMDGPYEGRSRGIDDTEPRGRSGALFTARDFLPLVEGVLTLRGKASIGGADEALLFVKPDRSLATCTVRPADQEPVKCQSVAAPLRANLAYLLEGQTEAIVAGVTELGATADTTKRGAFKSSGEPVAIDEKNLKQASDRPQLPTLSSRWIDAKLGGQHVVLELGPKGELLLTNPEDAGVVVVNGASLDGPALGSPMVFLSDSAAVLLFQTGKGLSGLRVLPSSVEPLTN